MALTTVSAVPTYFPLAEIECTIGRMLIEADILRMEIAVLEYDATSERKSQFLAMLAVGLLIGAAIGCAILVRL